MALWANRRTRASEKTYWFFDNPFNEAVCNALREAARVHHADEPLRLVLVDDHFGTGTTALQAKGFLREKLGNDTKIVYFPIVSRRVRYLENVEDMLPYTYEDPKGNKVFSITKEEFQRNVFTDASYFPYMRKDIIGE